jgi:N utilization substance protein A
MVVNELRGEKIDVVPWSADPATYVANALQPAKVKEVRIDPDTQTASVIVPDYQLSLAIGKEGQNARLAARLTGWRIDIKSETQFADEQRGGGAAAPTPVTPDAAEAATPDAAPEMAAEAGGPTTEQQPAPTGDAEAGEPAAEAEETAADAEEPVEEAGESAPEDEAPTPEEPAAESDAPTEASAGA